MPIPSHILIVIAPVTLALAMPASAEQAFIAWQAEGDAIIAPLTATPGDPARGRTLAIRPDKGTCLTCHVLPIPEEDFHGTIGPDLTGVGARLTAAQLRLRIADEQRLNPLTIMPGYYRDPATLNQVAFEYAERTMLTAQEVEDVVAYLVTLK